MKDSCMSDGFVEECCKKKLGMVEIECEYCDETFIGYFPEYELGSHKREEHPEEVDLPS